MASSILRRTWPWMNLEDIVPENEEKPDSGGCQVLQFRTSSPASKMSHWALWDLPS
jgi:hypothetical protein